MENTGILSVGASVFVKNSDLLLYECFGTVSKILEGVLEEDVFENVVVELHENVAHGSSERFVSFQDTDLVVFDLRDYPHLRIPARQCHCLYSLPYIFSPENDCMHVDCKDKVTKRILYNFFGSVSEIDVCEKHVSFDFLWGDGFPYKKDYSPLKNESRILRKSPIDPTPL